MIYKFKDFIIENKKVKDEDNERLQKMISKFNLKKFPIAIPPKTRDECLNMFIDWLLDEIENQGDDYKMSFGDKEFSKDELQDKELIRKESKNLSLKVLQHELIHYIQQKDPIYKGMYDNTPTDDEHWEKTFALGPDSYYFKVYLSCPQEIMAYAFSYAIKDDGNDEGKKYFKNHKDIYKSYKNIGGKVFELFKEYVKDYKNYLKK